MLQPSPVRADVLPASEDRLDRLGRSLFAATDSPGVHGRTALFETVIDGLTALTSRLREPDTEVLYKVSNYYSAEHDRGLLWNDPALGIEWPVSVAEAEVSDKDRKQPLLSSLSRYFHYDPSRAGS